MDGPKSDSAGSQNDGSKGNMRLKLVWHHSNKRELKWNHLVRLKRLKPKLKKLLTKEIWVSQ